MLPKAGAVRLRRLTIQVTQDSEELLQLDLNIFLQREWIQVGVFDPQLGFRRFGNVWAVQQSLIRCLGRRLIDAFGFPLLLFPLHQFERWLEVVGELTPFLGIQVIHQRHQFRVPEAVVPEELPHRRPVLLLAVRVVVLPISPAARPGQLHRPPRQMPVQRPVEELAAVVGVEVFHRIGHDRFQCLQLHQHGVGALVPDGAVLRPPAEQLGKRKGIDIIPLGAVIAMRHGIRLDRTQPRGGARAGTRPHRVTQQGAGPRGRESLLRMLHARGPQEAVNLRGTDLQKFLPKSFRQRRGAPLVMFQPFGQRRLEQLAAQLVAGQPDGLEHRQHRDGIVDDFGSAPFGRGRGQRTVQEPQGGFAMIPAHGAKLIKDARLVRTTGALVAAVNTGQRLAFGRQTQVRCLGNHEYESTYQQTPRPPPRPGNI